MTKQVSGPLTGVAVSVRGHMHRTILALAALALITAVGPAGAATPKKGTFAGTLGVKVPKGAQAEVRALSRADGTVAAAGAAKRSGAFSLSLPAGAYVVVGTLVPRPGDGRVTQIRTGLSLKAGQKRVKANLKKRKRVKRKARKAGARAAFIQELGQVTPGRIAVAIPDFTGNATGDLGVVMGGLDDLMINDVLNAGQEECNLSVIASGRDRAELLKELEFQQSPYVDPATRVKRNIIIGDAEVRGTVTDLPGGKGKVEVRIVDSRTGKEYARLETIVDTQSSDFFGPFEELSKQTAKELCKLHDAYEVTLDVKSDANLATHSASGTIKSTLLARASAPKRPVWRDSGPLSWQNVVLTTKIAQCPYTDVVVPGTSWSVTILDDGAGSLQVVVGLEGRDATTASVDCLPDPGGADPPPIPGQPGPSLLTTGPLSFTLPYAGGVQAISGIVADGGDGFFNTGTITVKPSGIAGPPG